MSKLAIKNYIEKNAELKAEGFFDKIRNIKIDGSCQYSERIENEKTNTKRR